MPDNFLDKQLDRLAKRSKSDIEKDEVRFSITLSRFNNRRLEYLRRKLNLSKQELINELLTASVTQLEMKMGLSEYDASAGDIVLTDKYAKLIDSKRPISAIFKAE